MSTLNTRVVLPFRGSLTAWKNGLTGCSSSSTKGMQNPAFGEEEPHASDMLGADFSESSFAQMNLGVLMGNKIEHAPATCPCSKGC